jgi:hypothetical protein
MPSVIDAPARVEHDEHDRQEAQPQVCLARSGFWHTLVQYVLWHRVHTSSRAPSSSRLSLHPIELPMERVAQENPTLFLQGFCGIHNG